MEFWPLHLCDICFGILEKGVVTGPDREKLEAEHPGPVFVLYAAVALGAVVCAVSVAVPISMLLGDANILKGRVIAATQC